ncbi:MAG: mandelate racemase/muconate lactonizing enzyme family protein [Lachnospiraceae bacterium]|jgi:galactonate dehydratase|nr:mandelate racemase/muconate lactonizing enzyme family protein [Lachnospiraceae bacterium]MCI8957989.1 mandelate racemase/muconate lactonizing enzyme family protein [Lachnospiraceae bacterium]
MKITDVKVLRANRSVFCRIFTDEGITGLGESGAWGFLEASAQAMLTMKEYLVGQNPLDIEHHWQYLYRFSHFRGAAVMGAMSAIDIALWDIAGKYYHTPVYRLLGGRCRDRVRVYNHTAGRTEEELVENAVRGVEEGYKALGHLNPYLDEPRTQPYADSTTAMLYKAEQRIARVREAVGTEVDLCLELHRRLEPGLAVQLSARLEPYNPMFLEDPIRPDNFDEMGLVASRCRVPIATGERINTVHEFEMLLERNACSYVRASLGVCGGFTGAKKIAAVAEAHHKSLVPHNPLSPVMTTAVVHFAAAVDNIAITEYPNPYAASTADHLTGSGVKLRQCDMVDRICEFRDGYLLVPEEDGLGIDVIPDLEERFPFRPHKIMTRLNADGSICDQ